jgi:uncharacterized protein
MRYRTAVIGAAAILLGALCGGAQEPPRSLRILIRAGVKTHGPGAHDHPAFLKDWTELLRARGAEVEGAMEFPAAAALEKADVLVMYAAEAGTCSPEQRERIEAFTKRGGGIVAIHDAVCGKDPQWFKTVIGGAWEHGKSKWHEGTVGIYVQDTPHPITNGLSNFFMDDEIYWDLHLQPEAKVIATGFRAFNEITPQMWVYEKESYRAFVSIPGHKHASFSLPHYRALLLRGIAWAGKREVDTFLSREELASLRYPEGGPARPQKAGERISVHPDFDLRLVVGEPDVIKPIRIDWDPQGRLWAALTPQYPNKAKALAGRPRDSLVYFDSRADGSLKRTVFYDQLDLVTSFVFHNDGVIVTQAPDILYLRDADGDGIADKVEVLFTGFGFGDTHAVTSNLRWGMDGWIYGTQGYSGGGSRNVTNGKGRNFGHIGNGVFRFRADGSAIEMVCAYGSNTWGLDFSWDGDLFFTMANGSHLRHVVLPDPVLARSKAVKLDGWKDVADHRDANPLLKQRLNPYLQIDFVGGFTAAAGSTLYDGGAWPEEYRQAHFVTECTLNLVHQDVVRPEGVTYRASKARLEEFVAGTDLWFRPIDTQIGPDGALYVVDFYNLAVVHNDTRGPRHGPSNAAVRPDRDHEHGRVWRVQHRQAKSLPAVDFKTVPGLIAALGHPNRWARHTALRLLCERADGVPELVELLRKSPDPSARLLAVWAIHRKERLTSADLSQSLRDGNAGVRKTAARVAALQGGDEAIRTIVASLDDADVRVRLEKIVALGGVPLQRDAIAALLKVSPSLQDPWSRAALAAALNASPIEALTAAAEAGDRVLAIDLAGGVGARHESELTAQCVQRVAAWPAAANPIKRVVLATVARSTAADPPPLPRKELSDALEALLNSGDAGVEGAAFPFAAKWPLGSSLSASLERVGRDLLRQLPDGRRPVEDRLNDLSALLAAPSLRARTLEASTGLLDPRSSVELQTGAIEALGGVNDSAVLTLLLGAYSKLTGPGREAILSQVLRRPEWSFRLLEEIGSRRFKAGDLGPNGIFRLRNHPDKAVASKAGPLLDSLLGGKGAGKNDLITSLLPRVEAPGDVARGKTLLADNCLKCHSYQGEGKGLAPDLTGMGLHGRADLLVHVLDPNRQVEPNYVSFNVRTRSGEVFNGIVVRETKESVSLRSAEGDREIRRVDIDVMVSTGLSLMPEGFESLGGEALRDILSYLSSDTAGFRVIDLLPVFSASTAKGLYDPKREIRPLPLLKFGIVPVEGIPFLVADPARTLNGNNALVLKGGKPEWACKTEMPRKVEVAVGFAFEKLHVLGGIAHGGTPDPARKPQPVAKLTFCFADGKEVTRVLQDGVEFADWSRRVDVKGSRFAEGTLDPAKRGQLRWFTLHPGRTGVVHHLVLESEDSAAAPTFLALTAEVEHEAKAAPKERR